MSYQYRNFNLSSMCNDELPESVELTVTAEISDDDGDDIRWDRLLFNSSAKSFSSSLQASYISSIST